MSSNNVVDLAQHFALDNRAHGFIGALKAINAILDPVAKVLGAMNKADQRILMQILAWRLEGGSCLPATQGLVHMPLLAGMSFEVIGERVELMLDAGVLEQVVLSKDAKGNPISMGFRWPALESMLEQGKLIADGPQMVGLDGQPLKPGA